MYLDPTHPAGLRAGIVAVCLAIGAMVGSESSRAEDVLKPLRVLGESGFHHSGSLSEIVVLKDGKRVQLAVPLLRGGARQTPHPDDLRG